MAKGKAPPTPPPKRSAEWWARYKAHRAGAAESHRQHESSKPPITAVLPIPRVLRLGGEEFVVNEFRLRDLAELQAYIEDSTPHPLADILPAEADPDPSTRRERLMAAWSAAKKYPPRLGSDEAGAILASIPGRLFYLWVCLRELNRVDMTRLAELLPKITPLEMASLRRTVWAIPAAREILSELDPDPSLSLTDWCIAFDTVHEHRNYKYAEMGELYLSQWRNINQGGKSRRIGITPRPGESPEQARLRVFQPREEAKGTDEVG